MLLTVTTTRTPATDLGFLLHKHPDRAQEFAVLGGTAHVFYPEATEARCTAALLLDLDPRALAGIRRSDPDGYPDERAYAASSLLAVALGKVFRSALSGTCKARPELPGEPLPLELTVPSTPARGGGAELCRRLFEPLGWTVEATPVPLDPAFPDWGDSPYVGLRLTGTRRLADALSHLYVLLPVLDGGKHYWVDRSEVDKLLRAGGTWLAGHPERDLITRRYLAAQPTLVGAALGRLAEVDDTEPEPPAEPTPVQVRLADLRKAAVLGHLRSAGAARVVDLGCGDGALLGALLADRSFTEILGVDVSARSLDRAERRLGLDRLPAATRDRITLRQSALTYTDARLAGFDAAVLMEVVEHVDPPRLPALARSVFGAARPGTVIVTTPNAEHNVRYPALPAGAFRHPDHRFEWTRAEFAAWADGVAAGYGYAVAFDGVGEDDPEVGPPTQVAVFTRAAA